MAPTAQIQADVRYRQRFVLITTTILLILSTASVVARLTARRITRQSFRSDDLFMTLALPFSYIDGICNYIGLTVGLGKHERTVTPSDRIAFRKVLFALQRGNPPCLFCVKTSILLFYMHIFATQTFRRCAMGMIIITGLWAIAAFFSNMLQCLPVAFFWDKTIPGGRCIPVTPIGVANASLSLAGDVIILMMPLPMIWKLHLDMKRKIALSGIFLLGTFVCVISLIRITLLPRLNFKDATYSQVYPGVLTYAELAVAIICGNLPVMSPLFGRWFRNKLSSARSKGNGYGYGGSTNGRSRAGTFGKDGSQYNSIAGGDIPSSQKNNFIKISEMPMARPDDASDLELTTNVAGTTPTNHHQSSSSDHEHYLGNGIAVTTDIRLDYRGQAASPTESSWRNQRDGERGYIQHGTSFLR